MTVYFPICEDITENEIYNFSVSFSRDYTSNFFEVHKTAPLFFDFGV